MFKMYKRLAERSETKNKKDMGETPCKPLNSNERYLYRNS